MREGGGGHDVRPRLPTYSSGKDLRGRSRACSFVMPTPPAGASTLKARPCAEIRAHATHQHHLAHILRGDHAGVVENEQRRRLRLGPGRKPGLERTAVRQAWILAQMLSSTGEGTPFSDRARGVIRWAK